MEKIENIFTDEQGVINYLQWKSDSWRNVAVALKYALESGDKESKEKAFAMFEKVKDMFSFAEI